MLLFSEMPVLILPTAVLLIITIGRAYTVLAERLIDRSHDSGSSRPNHDLDDSQVRHA
jgi:hypothetical protein